SVDRHHQLGDDDLVPFAGWPFPCVVDDPDVPTQYFYCTNTISVDIRDGVKLDCCHGHVLDAENGTRLLPIWCNGPARRPDIYSAPARCMDGRCNLFGDWRRKTDTSSQPNEASLIHPSGK